MRVFAVLSVLMLLIVQQGCNKPAAEVEKKVATEQSATETKHDGWWCAEHGVPEGECALCSAKVAADFQKKGDWCKQHDRPESQCFICYPEYEEKFAALYEAKYGKKPPAREK